LNAVLSYEGYVVKTLWPTRLAAHYPLPRQFSMPQVVLACALLLAITALAIALRRSRPYLLAGWLWYIGMLVPAIGLVQVGRQAMADRYTYLPQIGLLMIVMFTLGDFLVSRSWLRAAASTAAAVILAALIVVSWQQTRFWHDDITLFQRALDLNEDDSEMHSNMSAAFADRKDFSAALPHAQRAVELDPDSPSAQANLAYILISLDQAVSALPHAQRSVELDPNSAKSRFLLGQALHLNNRDREAMQQLKEAQRLRSGEALIAPHLRSP
jgi:tetratricopeptide (TPR) repeat protein